jgi:outer membrane protein assembly factor BamB
MRRLLLTALTAFSALAAADYPCWRGNGDGVWIESGQPLIADLDQKKLVWESEERGLLPTYYWLIGGVGGLVHADGRIFLTCAAPMGELRPPAHREKILADLRKPGRRGTEAAARMRRELGIADDEKLADLLTTAQLGDVVLAIDAATGTTVWKQSFPGVFANPAALHMNGEPLLVWPKPKAGPHNLPAVLGQRVAVIGYGGDLYCLDAASGALHWRKKAQHRPGTMTSVLPAGGHFVCLCDTGTDPAKPRLAFVGIKPEDGSIAWKLPPPYDINATVGKTGPVRHSSGGKELALFGGTAVDASTGTVLWEVPGHGPHGSAAIGGGYLVLSGPVKDGGPVGYRLGDDITQAPTQAWQLGAEYAVSGSCTPCIYRDHAWYKAVDPANTQLSRMVAVELATGKVAATEPSRNDACGACHAADGLIFYEDGAWIADPANLARATGSIGTSGDGAVDYADCHAPCFVDGRLFVRGLNHVRCYDLRR